MQLPLEGVRVIAVEQYGAGPFGSMQLADLGAEVIKIENPGDGGDMGRYVGPYRLGEEDSHFFQSLNRNKKSLTLDLKNPAGRDVILRLVEGADAVMNNLRGDLPEKLGLTYAALKGANPRVVCAHLSAYGRTGERAAWPGYDYLMQAEAGYLSLTGEPGAPPGRMGLSVVDFMTGLYSAHALVAALLGARNRGVGGDIDVNLFDCALQNLSYLGAWYLNEGHVQGREPASAHPSLTPSQLYRTKDSFIFIMCNKEKFWPVLCELLGAAHVATDPRFADFSARLHHREQMNEILEERLLQRTTAEWLALFQGRVPAAPVNDIASALDSQPVMDGGTVWELPHATRGTVRVIGAPYRVAGAELPRKAAPMLDEHTDEILAGCGFTPIEIESLRSAKAV